uniref:Uncharacterized protein n=1 Tax=Meloidogyne enterolobii TaxID=390850 RepID=A0A6V7VCE0_MELEN|nr:unnamed protein product [Meloidogyne enterolobii]
MYVYAFVGSGYSPFFKLGLRAFQILCSGSEVPPGLAPELGSGASSRNHTHTNQGFPMQDSSHIFEKTKVFFVFFENFNFRIFDYCLNRGILTFLS